MQNETNGEIPRAIDDDLLRMGKIKRAQALNQFLAEQLKLFDPVSYDRKRSHADVGRLRGQAFGELLVKATKDMLTFERHHHQETNWNTPETEAEVYRRTAALGTAYYAAPEEKKEEVIRKALDFFTALPMPLEELALEERAIRSGNWEQTPLEERRIWLKIQKAARFEPIILETRCFPLLCSKRPTEQRGSDTTIKSSAAEQNMPRTPARKRFGEIRRSKSRR